MTANRMKASNDYKKRKQENDSTLPIMEKDLVSLAFTFITNSTSKKS